MSTICSKAKQQIGMLDRKCYRYSDVETLKRLYVAFIHRNCCLVSSPL